MRISRFFCYVTVYVEWLRWVMVEILRLELNATIQEKTKDKIEINLNVNWNYENDRSQDPVPIVDGGLSQFPFSATINRKLFSWISYSDLK